jgi:hypothetical protein
VSEVEAYVNDDAFRRRYPDAYERWRDAYDLYMVNPERHASRIGHDCREAMMLFASDFAARHGVQLELAPSYTKIRVRAVLDGMTELLGDSVSDFARALLSYWSSVSDLAQRQEHALGREGRPLGRDDARRLVFQTMLVMAELDRTLDEAGGRG